MRDDFRASLPRPGSACRATARRLSKASYLARIALAPPSGASCSRVSMCFPNRHYGRMRTAEHAL